MVKILAKSIKHYQRLLAIVLNISRVKMERKDPHLGKPNFVEHVELIANGEPTSQKKRKARREPLDAPVEPKRELTLTTRQQALHSSKDASANGGIEFHNGLPPAPSIKQEKVLIQVQQQLKRAEAAWGRKLQREDI